MRTIPFRVEHVLEGVEREGLAYVDVVVLSIGKGGCLGAARRGRRWSRHVLLNVLVWALSVVDVCLLGLCLVFSGAAGLMAL